MSRWTSVDKHTHTTPAAAAAARVMWWCVRMGGCYVVCLGTYRVDSHGCVRLSEAHHLNFGCLVWTRSECCWAGWSLHTGRYRMYRTSYIHSVWMRKCEHEAYNLESLWPSGWQIMANHLVIFHLAVLCGALQIMVLMMLMTQSASFTAKTCSIYTQFYTIHCGLRGCYLKRHKQAGHTQKKNIA